MDKKIAKNFIYSFAYQVLVIIAPLITAPYVSRVLHTDGVGLYSYTEGIATAFALFAMLGFNTYGQREIAYCKDDPQKRSIIFYEIIIFRVFTTIIVSLVYIAYCFLYKDYTIYLLPQTAVIIAVMFDVSWYFQGLENFKITVLRNAVVKVLTIIFIFLFVKTKDDLFLYVIIHSASVLISNLFYVFVIRKYITKVNLSVIKPFKHLKGTIEFFIPLFAVKIYSYLDRIMLGWLLNATDENGYYEQARKITTLVVALIISINSVMMSRVASLYAKKKKEEIIDNYSRSFNVLLLLLFPICIGLFLISDNFVIWYFGEEFQKVSILLKLSCPLTVFMCVGNFVGVQFLAPTGKQNKMTLAYVIAAIVNVVLNFFLIPSFLSVGAMIASIIAELISCFIQIALLISSPYRFNMLKKMWKYAVASLVMGICIYLFHLLITINGFLGTLIDVIIGMVMYSIMLFIVKEDNAMDIRSFIKNRLSKRISNIS